jgi:ribosomal protein S18 acetylase RimI-like enzyme
VTAGAPRSAIDVVSTDGAAFEAASVLFDAYRVHYGAAAAPSRAAGWLREQITAGALFVWVIRDTTGEYVGLVTVAPMPASVNLGTNWSIRDLYVNVAARGRGHAEALLRHVIGIARDHDIRRVGLQTEIDNPAISLYRRIGFEPVDGYVGLALDAQH